MPLLPRIVEKLRLTVAHQKDEGGAPKGYAHDTLLEYDPTTFHRLDCAMEEEKIWPGQDELTGIVDHATLAAAVKYIKEWVAALFEERTAFPAVSCDAVAEQPTLPPEPPAE